MAKLKIYALDDGRREFLVATTSRKEACDLFGISSKLANVGTNRSCKGCWI